MKKNLLFNKLYIIILMLLITDFVSAQFTSSNLPIVVITTDGGVNIVDDPKVAATMKIIDRGAGQINFLTDVNNPLFLNYSGKIGIEFRGNSSQIPDKKPYGFDTMKSDYSDTEEVSLLGISKGDDWILNNLSFDPSMMHDFIAYNLARKMGNYAVSTVYCEVVVNGNYRGLYVLQEKPKRKRVGVSKIATTDNSGINLTGGYLTEVDRPDPGQQPAWTMDSYISGAQNLIHITPKSNEITPQQNAYIESVFRALESKATNSNVETGYPSVIDVPSFIDYMIVGELGSSCDIYTYSTKFYKDRGGKLIAGPVWDFNLGFGTDMLFNGAVPGRSVVNQWQFNNSDNQGPKFFKDLYNNSTYRCNMAKRFNELSAPNKPLNVAYIHQFIDSTATIIQAATARDYARWGTQMPFKRNSFSQEIAYLKNFISQRSSWMTTTMGSFSACANTTVPNVVINEIMYSPKTSTVFTDADAQEFIELKNAGTTPANLTGVYFRGVGLGYQFPPNTTLAPGQIIVLASDSATFETKYGFAPFGQYALNLNNSSQTLTLSAAFGEIIDQVTYSDKAPWPNAKTNKKSLELMNTNLDNAIGTNWFTSTSDEGSPGAENNFIPTPATSVTVTPVIATIIIGATQQLNPTVLPANSTNKNVSWSSSDTAIATVSTSGLVTGVGAGQVIITATTIDGGFTAISTITVNAVAVESITITPNTVSVEIGKTASLTASILPVNASNKNVIWSSSDVAIASVSTSGVVTAVAEGNAVITATTVDGSFTATSQITIIPVQGITINVKRSGSSENPKIHVWSKETGSDVGITNSSNWPNNLPNMTVGANTWYNYTVNKTQIGVLFVYANNQTADFKYFNQNVWISLDASGNIIGSPSFTDPNVNIPVQSISVTPTTVAVEVGKSQTLTASILPVNASNKNITWSSSNVAIALVNTSGVVNAISEGTTVITATTVDGSFTATTQVTVVPVQGITINVKRSGSSENPKIHVWSKETGSDVGVTNSSNWPNNLPNMTVGVNTWFKYTVNKMQVGVLFVYANKQTADFKYFNQNVWISLDSSGNIIGSPSFTDPNVNIPVQSVSVNPTSISVPVGTTQTIAATVLPSNASNKNIVWSSSNSAIATVSASGVVTAVSQGNADITATTVDGSFTATTATTVTPSTGYTIYVKRQGTNQQNPKIHVWSKETGVDVPVTNTNNWPNSLPNMTNNSSQWYSYPVTKNQFGFLFSYTDKQTVDFKYYSKNVWVLLDNNGNTISVTDVIPTTFRKAAKKEIEAVFTVIPNPVSDNFTVQYSTGSNSNSTLNIFNLSGQIIYTESFETEMFEKEFNAQELRLTSGVYILQVQSVNGVDTKKIIVK